MLYAKNRRVFGQVGADLGFVVAVVLLVFVARWVNRAIRLFAVPAQNVAGTTTNLSSQLSDGGDAVATLPLVGDQLQKPFHQLSGTVASLTGSIESLITLTNTTAKVVAIIVFVVPLVIYLWKWVPWRYRFIHEAAAGQRLLKGPLPAELFALRAIATAPLHDLAKISPNPLGAWQSGDQTIIARLANLELALVGLHLPVAKTPSDQAEPIGGFR